MVDKPAEILMYGIIGADITSQQITAQLASIDGDVVVRINSRGGDVFDGVAILNALRGHDGNVTCVVDGLAASAASFIAMAGSEVVMNRNSELMIHNGHSLAIGGAEDMRKVADNLERTNANIAAIYAEKAGGTPDEWRAAMTAETWYSAEEAVAAGLADRVEAIKDRDAATVKAHFDLSIFNHAGREHAPAPRMPIAHETPLPVEVEVSKGKEPLVASLNESSLTVLGLDADADDETINAAITKLAEKPEPEAESETAEPTLEQATQIAAKAGLATITVEALDGLRNEASLGAQARAQQIREADEREVDAAIKSGKIAPARRDHHLQALAADRDGHKAVLASLQPGLVPLAETGHGVSNEITNEEDALYASLFGTAGKES